MNAETPESLIPYDEIVQEALRAVVGRVLGSIEAGGGQLPGGHHFYITFKSQAPGVEMPRHLLERFPDDMTIVLQNRFWDLKVGDKGFSVGLSFNQTASMLFVPFAAITSFVDPSVDFGLQFQVDEGDIEPPIPEEAENDEAGDEPAQGDAADAGSNVVTVDFGKKR